MLCAQDNNSDNNIDLKFLIDNNKLRAKLRRGRGTSCKPAGTETLISAAAHNYPAAIIGGIVPYTM